jgi:hypothetical protein
MTFSVHFWCLVLFKRLCHLAHIVKAKIETVCEKSQFVKLVDSKLASAFDYQFNIATDMLLADAIG